MTWTLLLLVMLQTAPTSIWPITVAGWITLFGFVVGPFVVVFSAGRMYTTLTKRIDDTTKEVNGFGERVGKVENRLAEHEGGMADVRTLMQSLMGAQAQLLEKIGEATRSAATCNDGTKEMGERVAGLIAKLDEKVTKWERETALELRGLTVELKARGLIDVPPSGGFTHGRQSDIDREKR